MNWPHAPVHWTFESGIYMLTAGTYQKQHFLNTPEKLDYFQATLFSVSEEFGWQLQAWAILSNHYHFIALSPEDPDSLRRMISKLHMLTAKEFNRLDAMPGRKVWHQYWDKHITHETSYLARLNYVHNNPARHEVRGLAEAYPWCSVGWFASVAEPAFAATVASFKTDRLSVPDDF